MSNIDSEIEYLSEFMTSERFERLRGRLSQRTRYMSLCLEDIFYPHNASATIRSAEAFGVQDIHAVQSLCHFSPSSHIVRGTDQWVDICRWSSTPELVAHLRAKGYRIVISSPHMASVTLENFDVQAGPFALFMGTEKTGISEWLMQQADESIYIPMVGFAESLNISVSAAIMLQQLSGRVRSNSDIEWQLKEQDGKELLLKWMKCSIVDVENILKRQFK